jgi:hypothetical protein
MSAITPNQLIKTALSSARLSTYELATTVVPRLSGSLALYAWNAQVAAAMLVPLHLCEVIIRKQSQMLSKRSTAPDGLGTPALNAACPQKASI